LLGPCKAPTTPDVTSGVRNAIDGLQRSGVAIDPGSIRYAMLGTTHCTNALLERRGLNRVGLIRLGASASMAIPPFVDWPPDLVAALGGHYAMLEGGFEFDGREILPLDVEAVRAAAERFKGEVDSIAIVGVFLAVDASQEARAAEIVRGVLGDVPVTFSHEIGSLGLLERENASILNAALVDAARAAASGFEAALTAHGVQPGSFSARTTAR
jgi:N-methylhydantoinase A/oxoprolinase/acetone carboxylase beta subunit